MSVEELSQLNEEEIKEKYAEITDFPNYDSERYRIFRAGYQANTPQSGNQYTGYLKEGNKILEKVRDDEPIFVLRAQDVTAPEIVLSWVAKNLDTVDEAKLKEAFQTVLAMRRYHSRRDPT